MKKIIQIKTIQPVSLAESRFATNVNRTLTYIPGTAIRGYLANAYIEKFGLTSSSQDEFYRLFNSDEVRFGNLYPSGEQITIEPVYPLPLTAFTCKINGGFMRTDLTGMSHGIKDYLIDFLVYEESGRQLDAYKDTCSQCKAPMERASGFYFREGSNFKEAKVKIREIAHNEISDVLYTTMPQVLYSLEAVEKNQYFIGFIYFKDSNNSNPLFTRLSEFLSDSENEAYFYLGAARRRGKGKVYAFPFIEPIPSTLAMEERFYSFNETIGEALSGKGIQKNKYYFSLTLHSDLILVDEYMREVSYLTEKELQKRFNIGNNILDNFKLKLAFLSTHTIAGWNAAWKLPKNDNLAITKGSVFLYESVRKINQDQINDLIEVLQKIEEDWIGIRKNEGFGVVSVCDDFHIKGREIC